MFLHKSQQNLMYYYCLLNNISNKKIFDKKNEINSKEYISKNKLYSYIDDNCKSFINTMSNIEFDKKYFYIPESNIFYLNNDSDVKSIVNNKNKDFFSESKIFNKIYVRNYFNEEKLSQDLYYKIHYELINFLNQVCKKRTFYNFKNDSKSKLFNFIKNKINNDAENNVFISNHLIKDFVFNWINEEIKYIIDKFLFENSLKENYLIHFNKLNEKPFLIQFSCPNIIYKSFYIEVSIKYFICMNNNPLKILSYDC